MLTRIILFGSAIVVLASSSIVAQDESTARKTFARANANAPRYFESKFSVQQADRLKANVMKIFKRAKLTPDQERLASEIVDKHTDAYFRARKAHEMVLTDKHRARRKAELEKAEAEGISGKAARISANLAMKLTRREVAEYDEKRKEVFAIANLMRSEISRLLTDEQLAALPKRRTKAKKSAQAVSLVLPNMT